MKHDSAGRRVVLVAAAFITAAFAAATIAGCGSSDSGGDVSARSKRVTSSIPGAAINDVDMMFVRMMLPHHQQAVEMASLAQTRAADPQVKQLAAHIKATQTAEIATMKKWLAVWGQSSMTPMTPMTPNGHHMSRMPSGMPSMPGGGMMPSGMQSMPGMQSSTDMARLKAATGKDFDKLFLQMMISHHEGAIQMARAEQAHGANPDVKAFAGRIITEQQAEIATMQKMLAAM